MKIVEIKETKYKCEHCGRCFDNSSDCSDHESFCQSAEPARELAKRFTELLKFAAQNGISVRSEYVTSHVLSAEFNESMGEIFLLPGGEG